jgi:hypothetical protein
VLELVAVHDDGAAADYAMAIYTPEPAAAPELSAKLVIIARLVARGVEARRQTGEKVWPARVMRWRAK